MKPDPKSKTHRKRGNEVVGIDAREKEEERGGLGGMGDGVWFTAYSVVRP
jgi:hypothetical protein